MSTTCYSIFLINVYSKSAHSHSLNIRMHLYSKYSKTALTFNVASDIELSVSESYLFLELHSSLLDDANMMVRWLKRYITLIIRYITSSSGADTS